MRNRRDNFLPPHLGPQMHGHIRVCYLFSSQLVCHPAQYLWTSKLASRLYATSGTLLRRFVVFSTSRRASSTKHFVIMPFMVCATTQPLTDVAGPRPRKLTSTDISFIKALISQHHTIYLDEIQEQLLSRRGTQISIPTLMRTLCRMQLTNKDVSGRALERNVEQRAIFMNYMAEIVQDPNMLMFGDEAAKDERTCVRKRGWSLRGCRCIQRKCFVRGQRYSILPILTLDGIITYDIIEGSVTSKRFVQFLQELVVGSNLLFFLVDN